MAKFKQGDKVLRKDDGGIGEVVEVHPYEDFWVYRAEFGGVRQIFCECQLEFAPKTFGLMIEFTDGEETVLRENNGGFENMDDEYAAVIAAVNKFYGKEEKPAEKPKWFTGRAMYYQDADDFVRGKIYPFDNGNTFDENGDKRPRLDDDTMDTHFQIWFDRNFIPVVE